MNLKRTLLATAVLAACTSHADAATSLYNVVGNVVVEENVNYVGQTDYGILAAGANNIGTFTGSTITVNMSKTDLNTTGIRAHNDARLYLGLRDKSDITIKTTQVGSTAGKFSIAVWADTPSGVGVGGQLEIKGRTVTIQAEGDENTGTVRAVYAATNTLSPTQQASIVIDADTVNISATSKHSNPAAGASAIVAMSTGKISILGNTTITADEAVLTRGNSEISINADGKHSTVINGNVNFSFDAPTSGTPVDAKVLLNLVGPNSRWTGNTVVSWNGTPTEEDTTLKVTGMTLALSGGAVWTPVETKQDSTTITTGQKYVALNVLNNNAGTINITNSAIDVTIEKMTGTGGTVNLATDLTAEAGQQTGRIAFREAAEDSTIDVKLKDAKMTRNLTSDEVSSEQAKSLLDAVDGEVAVTTTVEEGMYNEGFDINADGSTISSGPNSVMQASLELAAATPLAINRILMNDVRKRLGDIRSSQGESGVWARYDGGRLSGSADLKNDFHTIQAGVDTIPDDSIRFGVSMSYTGSDADYRRGTADMDLYGLAAYGVWLGNSGQFADIVARMASAKTDIVIDGTKKGAMDNVALSLSGEFGWRFDVSSPFYVEPQVEATYTYVNAEQLALSDGSIYDFSDADSFLGRAGMAFGLKCPNQKGNVYARLSAVHEFLGDLKVTGANGAVYETDGKDTWLEYGVGGNFNLTSSTYLWADVERTSGSLLDEDWRATVGIRHAF